MLAAIDQPVLPDHARASEDPAILAAILLPGINLAIWQGHRVPAVPDAAALASVDDITLTCDAGHLRADMQLALTGADYARVEADAIAGDVAMLGGRLARLLDRDRLAVRLEVVETDACRKFHADHVSVRLIRTYAGAATQWLDARDAAALKAGAEPDGLTIRQLGTGDVALFKGRQWAPDGAIVHRSPPIAGTGQRRLVLVIDPAPDGQD